MESSLGFYRQSGKFSPLAPLIVLIGGLIGAAISGAIYAYALAWIPFIYLNIILVVGYGIAMGAITVLLVKIGKVRNTPLVFAAGFVIGSIAEYIGWVFWILAMSEQEVLLVDPLSLMDAVLTLGKEGVWSFKDMTPKGAVLYLMWGIEALWVVLCPAFMAFMIAGDDVFCESAGQWADDEIIADRLIPITNEDEFKLALNQGNFQPLLRLQKLPHGAFHYTRLKLYSCENDPTFFVLTVLDVHDSTDKEGNT